MRHGIAADPVRGMRDADRALTEEGVRKTARIAAGLRALGIEIDAVLSSPYRRAEETAHLVAEALRPGRGVELYPPLAAGATPAAALVHGLQPPHGAERLLLVGHQPDLGELASQLLTGAPTLVPLPFKKGAVAAIAVARLPPRQPGLLEWFLTPGQLRALAAGRK